MLYGCEIWSLILREVHRLLFENWILRWICGHKWYENGEWRRRHSEELHSLYRSPNIFRVIKSRRLRWAGHVARMVEVRSAFKILTSTPAGKKPLGRPRRRWEDNFRMDLKKIGINTKNLVGWTSLFHKPWDWLVSYLAVWLEPPVDALRHLSYSDRTWVLREKKKTY